MPDPNPAEERLSPHEIAHGVVAIEQRFTHADRFVRAEAYDKTIAEREEAMKLVEAVEEDHWPYEWQVATAERKRRQAAERQRDKLAEALDNLLEVISRVNLMGEVNNMEDLDAARHDALAALSTEESE